MQLYNVGRSLKDLNSKYGPPKSTILILVKRTKIKKHTYKSKKNTKIYG